MGSRGSSRAKRSLFDADQLDLPFEAYALTEPQPVARPAEQLPLFEGRVPLVGEIEAALMDGDYPSAHAAYDRLRATYPADGSLESFEFLSLVPQDTWTAPYGLEERLSSWRVLAKAYPGGSPMCRPIRDGFFRRLLCAESARDVAISHPSVAADVANHLLAAGEWRVEREVVRDVLLAGIELKPTAFEDEPLRDLLGEEGEPEWLASLGAIRRLWPRTVPKEADLVKLSSALPEGERARALDFWFCLCVSGLGSRIPEELRQSGRRRMKQLHGALHEEFMTGRRVRTV